jgi:ribosomal 30S subunit maturation factor RimM
MSEFIKLGILGRTHGFKGDIILHTNLTPEEAKQIVNKPIFISRKDLNIASDEVFSTDLIGFSICDESGKFMGNVRRIENFGAGEILDCGNFMVPYEDKIVIQTDTAGRKIVVKTEYFTPEKV